MKRLLLLLAVCGGKSYTNNVETPRVTLAEVHAPFLFDLEGKLFVGNVTTGQVAYVTNGWSPVL